MKRYTINFIIDTIAFIDFIFLATTGILVRYILPKGSGSYITVWGLDRHGWGDIHFWLALIFLTMILIHIILHWDWTVCMIRGNSDKSSDIRIMAALFAFLLILILAVAPLISPVSGSREGGGYGGRGRNINGSHEEAE
ncbi:MAG: DUF4405 domain-containing protein [Nitrospinota bacterium]|nr:DUF4405 domain-containing protein [Nitrospinota bacterium]